MFAVGLLFGQAPRRKQPALSWLLFGTAVAIERAVSPGPCLPGTTSTPTVLVRALGT